MHVDVLSVGKPRDPALVALCLDYARRARPVFKVEWSPVSEGDPRGSRVPQRAVQAEGQRLIKRLAPRAMTVALDERGKRYTSVEWARWLGQLREEGHALQLLIGGAHGLSSGVLERCARRVSLSPMTLPHDLALVVLLEQIYRARAILLREPYHH